MREEHSDGQTVCPLYQHSRAIRGLEIWRPLTDLPSIWTAQRGATRTVQCRNNAGQCSYSVVDFFSPSTWLPMRMPVAAPAESRTKVTSPAIGCKKQLDLDSGRHAVAPPFPGAIINCFPATGPPIVPTLFRRYEPSIASVSSSRTL